MSARYRWVIAHDEPEIVGYDQDLWVDRLHAYDPDIEALVSTTSRRSGPPTWRSGRRRPPRIASAVGVHRERGRESVELMFHMIGGHDRVHLGQARRTLEAVRARG